MDRVGRWLVIGLSLVQAALAIGFFVQAPAAVQLWPFEGTTSLTFIFVASIFAAAAASTLWVALRRDFGALAGIGLDYLAILIPVTVFGFRLGAERGDKAITSFASVCALGILYGVVLLLWSRRHPIDDRTTLPGPVRWSFLVFVIALIILSGLLLAQVPNLIPWMITPTLSILIGWIFAGAAAYFIYGLIRPAWSNAAGQLIGFLVYDLVLIVPFAVRLPAVADQFRLGLFLYTGFLVYSGLLAVYYLFVHRPTRVAG